MVRALGYSLSAFDPSDPGRLCRGRERWVEAYPLAEDPGPPRLASDEEDVVTDKKPRDFKGGEVVSLGEMASLLDDD